MALNLSENQIDFEKSSSNNRRILKAITTRATSQKARHYLLLSYVKTQEMAL